MPNNKNKTSLKVLIILASLYFLLNIVSFFVESIIAGMKYDIALLLRITTLILDVTFIVTGLLTGAQVYLRKRIRIQSITAKRPKTIIYLADTISVLVFFFILYYVRLEILYQLEKISQESFTIGFWISLASALFFGAFFKSIIKNIKRRLQKKQTIVT